MPVYVVTWDLNREKPNYAAARAAFINHIDRYEHTRDEGLDSVRFISTSWTATEVRDDLRKKMDNNDRLFISQVFKSSRAGWLSTAVWNWLDART